MMRVRLKADGRIVEILPDGSERALVNAPVPAAVRSMPCPAVAVTSANGRPPDAAYARGVRARTRLTQAEFAARIGVPIETVRNWEQGKRSPRGPARALLKVIDRAPDLAFAVLRSDEPRRTTEDGWPRSQTADLIRARRLGSG
jgi:putative transcriptional regulator